MFFDAASVPSEVFRLLPQDGNDDDGRMDEGRFLSEPFMELISFILKENISDVDLSGKNYSNWQGELTSQDASKNISSFCFTMDEAANVCHFEFVYLVKIGLSSCITKKKVIDQLLLFGFKRCSGCCVPTLPRKR